jgi:putative SOS response-associated peptidase YedK
MCGRFTLRAPPTAVAEQFVLPAVPPFEPRFNVAPSQPVAVVRMAGEQPPARRELVWLRWGLVPSWADDPALGNRLINARAETAADKPAFRAAMRRRRCLVVADGFYEWQPGESATARRQPYFIRLRDDRPFGFAGLWESWERPDLGVIESCTILTTAANALVQPIHDRMPVIISPRDYDRWLDPALDNPDQFKPLLVPYPAEEMAAYRVSTLVNSPANNDPRCVAAMEGPTAASLF